MKTFCELYKVAGNLRWLWCVAFRSTEKGSVKSEEENGGSGNGHLEMMGADKRTCILASPPPVLR